MVVAGCQVFAGGREDKLLVGTGTIGQDDEQGGIGEMQDIDRLNGSIGGFFGDNDIAKHTGMAGTTVFQANADRVGPFLRVVAAGKIADFQCGCWRALEDIDRGGKNRDHVQVTVDAGVVVFSLGTEQVGGLKVKLKMIFGVGRIGRDFNNKAHQFELAGGQFKFPRGSPPGCPKGYSHWWEA